jgi:hypothetical protein
MDNKAPNMTQVDTRSFDEILNTPMTQLEELQNIYCEMYKDVYGIKARWYRETDIDRVRADINHLQAALSVQMDREEQAQAAAVAAFEQLAKISGREDAKRFQHQAYGTDGDDEFLEFRMGLPYGYFKRAE